MLPRYVTGWLLRKGPVWLFFRSAEAADHWQRTVWVGAGELVHVSHFDTKITMAQLKGVK